MLFDFLGLGMLGLGFALAAGLREAAALAVARRRWHGRGIVEVSEELGWCWGAHWR